MHHLADDRPGPDDRDLDDQVVEALGLHARQRRHLRARLDLEDADGVGALEHRVDRRGRRAADAARSMLDASCVAHERDRLLEHGHHAQAEEVDLDEARGRAQSSLSHWITERPGIVAGSSGTTSSSRPAAIDHAARVLAEVTRQPLSAATTADEVLHTRRFDGRRRRHGAAPRRVSLVVVKP